VVAMLKTTFAQDSAAAAQEQWASVADVLRVSASPSLPN